MTKRKRRNNQRARELKQLVAAQIMDDWPKYPEPEDLEDGEGYRCPECGAFMEFCESACMTCGMCFGTDEEDTYHEEKERTANHS